MGGGAPLPFFLIMASTGRTAKIETALPINTIEKAFEELKAATSMRTVLKAMLQHEKRDLLSLVSKVDALRSRSQGELCNVLFMSSHAADGGHKQLTMQFPPNRSQRAQRLHSHNGSASGSLQQRRGAAGSEAALQEACTALGLPAELFADSTADHSHATAPECAVSDSSRTPTRTPMRASKRRREGAPTPQTAAGQGRMRRRGLECDI